MADAYKGSAWGSRHDSVGLANFVEDATDYADLNSDNPDSKESRKRSFKRQWREFFTANRPNPDFDPEPGEYRCISSITPRREAGGAYTRHFYFESSPSNRLPASEYHHNHDHERLGPHPSERLFLLLRVTYWEPGLVKHVNLRRAWRIDVNDLVLRASGRERYIPAIDLHMPGMSQYDRRLWLTYLGDLEWDHRKPAEDEKIRAQAALQKMLHSNLFCAANSMWNEVKGACITGGPTCGENKNCMDRPGWDFKSAGPYVVPPLHVD
jgi:hypothetical protein